MFLFSSTYHPKSRLQSQHYFSWGEIFRNFNRIVVNLPWKENKIVYKSSKHISQLSLYTFSTCTQIMVGLLPCHKNLHIKLIDHLNHLLLPLALHHLLECLLTAIPSIGASLDRSLAYRKRKWKQKSICLIHMIKQWYFTGILSLSVKWIGKWNKCDLKL